MSVKTRALTAAELRRLAAVLTGPLPDAELPHAACLALLLGTGGRIREILGMTVRDVYDFDAGKPRPEVSRKIEKRGEKDVRLAIPFPWEALGRPVETWIVFHRLRGPEALFIGRSYNAVRKMEARLLARAGIDRRGIGFHGLRKTALRLIREHTYRVTGDHAAADRYAQTMAAHSRLETTLAYLTDRDPKPSAEIVKGAFREALTPGEAGEVRKTMPNNQTPTGDA